MSNNVCFINESDCEALIARSSDESNSRNQGIIDRKSVQNPDPTLSDMNNISQQGIKMQMQLQSLDNRSDAMEQKS